MRDDVERATIRDVAALAQVGISTVSRYINQSGYVDINTGERIRLAIEELNYLPSLLASSLRSHSSNIVILVVPDIRNPFYSSIARTVQGLLAKMNYVMMLVDSEEGKHEAHAISVAQQVHASGILIGSVNIHEKIVEQIMKCKIPTVALNAFQSYPFDTVHVDRNMGTFLATEHLLSLGHRNIAFLGGLPNTMIEESRLSGYLDAMRKGFHSPGFIIEHDFSFEAGYLAGKTLLKQADGVTAVCCANDQIALGFLSLLHEREIAVPHHISITGMDNIPYASIANPGLTTVTNDPVVFASEGVRLLLDRISGADTEACREVSVQHELIVRTSTAYVP